MSSKPVKHTTKPATKHNVPIVNVFDEDQNETTHEPARRPVVVEIEDVPTQMESPIPPPMPQQAPEPVVQRVWQSQPTIQSPFTMPQEQPAPEVSNIAPVPPMPMQEPAPVTQPMMPPAPQPMGMNAEPTLPSFFEHDLKNGMNQQPMAPMQGMPAMGQAQTQPMAPNMFADASAVTPQGVVGEINDAAEGGGSNKKLIGIILMVLAVLILAIGGLFLYARNLFTPTTVATPTPEVIATPIPTPVMSATPIATASATPLPASESAALKKKVKVDVLNGTKTAGLASKEAAVIKAAGFTTGTVGNGKPENAGTIVVAPAYKALAAEIQVVLKDFTFKITEDAKATAIVVTLGQ